MQDSHTSESAQSAVEDAIISGILSARIRPGTRLSENQLASLFGVSRTRIRGLRELQGSWNTAETSV